MQYILGIIVTLLGVSSSSLPNNHLEDSSCPSDWVQAQTEGCFKFLSSETNITWLNAQYACEMEGGYLAEPKTLGQMEFLTGIASLEESFFGIKFWWIGLEDIGLEGVWTWQHSREETAHSFWGDGSPSDQPFNKLDCAYVQLNEGHLSWKDDDCRINIVDKLSIAPICQRDVSSPEKTTTSRSEASTTTKTTTNWPETQTTTGLPVPKTTTRIPATTTEIMKGCPDSWSEIEGRCFLIVLDVMSWLDAREKCYSIGADLASIHSQEQDTFINGLIYKSRTYWLGGSDFNSEGNWTWSNGSPWNFQRWSTDDVPTTTFRPTTTKPKDYVGGVDKNCLSYPSYSYEYWKDKQCAEALSFICELN